ncbi:hypothetical protein [Streptomyces sp. NPDC020983]|uniref:hypothetical protein n=1 Tax=Streptomyces sp. NPDC020983 TaxID=3365106 RepID=UPI0037973C2E
MPSAEVRMEFRRGTGQGLPRAELCALLLADGAVRGPADLVVAGAPGPASGAVTHTREDGADGTALDTLVLDLASLESAVTAVLVVIRAEGGPAARIPAPGLRALAAGRHVRIELPGVTGGPATVVGECYRDGGEWRLRALHRAAPPFPSAGRRPRGAGAGGAGRRGAEGTRLGPGLLRIAYGGVGASGAALGGEGVSGAELGGVGVPGAALGEGGVSGAVLGGGGVSGAVLGGEGVPGAVPGGGGVPGAELGALFELADGRKGVVQALGGATGALWLPPYVQLDTGGAGGRAELTVNLDHAVSFRRVLVFLALRGGSFAEPGGTVEVRPEHGPPADFELPPCGGESAVCALLLLVREGEALRLRREARYLPARPGLSPQRTVDYAYGWALRWVPADA